MERGCSCTNEETITFIAQGVFTLTGVLNTILTKGGN